MTTPTFLVRPVARLEAFDETTYSSSSAAARTFSRVAADTCPLPLSARETVAVETPASSATWLIPGTAHCLPAVSVFLFSAFGQSRPFWSGAPTASYPSGQRDLTVNQTAQPSEVRILYLPPRIERPRSLRKQPGAVSVSGCLARSLSPEVGRCCSRHGAPVYRSLPLRGMAPGGYVGRSDLP